MGFESSDALAVVHHIGASEANRRHVVDLVKWTRLYTEMHSLYIQPCCTPHAPRSPDFPQSDRVFRN